MLCFASGSSSSGGTPRPKTPEEIQQELIDELETRMAGATGAAILGTSGDTPETRRIALRLLEEIKDLEPGDELAGTKITAAQALASDAIFGQIVARRLNYGDPQATIENINSTRSKINNQIDDLLDEDNDSTVDAIADDTRDQAVDILNTKERKVGAQETLEKARSLKLKLENIMRLADSDIIPRSSKGYSAADKKEVQKTLKEEHGKLSTDIKDLEILADWENGVTPPAKFAYIASERWLGDQKSDTPAVKNKKKETNAALNTFIGDTKNATMTDVTAGKLPDITDDSKWEKYNVELQERVRERMADIIPVKIKIAEINERIYILNKYIDSNGAEEKLRKLHETLSQHPEAQSGMSLNPLNMWSDLNNKLGIQWLSLSDIAVIFKSLKDAVEEVGKQQEQLRRAGAASYFGKLVSKFPGYEEVGQILDATNEKKNNDVKKGYMEYLNSPAISIGFDGMFKPGTGLLHKHKNDPNRAMAILEVAAQKGMLYDINGDESFDEVKILGKWPLMDYLPPEWNASQRQNYYETLRYMTLQGREKQADAAKPMPVYSTPEKSISVIKKLIEGRDLWFAKGYMAKVMGKGKTGELSALMADAVFERMQKDEWLRSVTPEAWFDSIGGLGAGNVAFSMGFMKWKRKDILKWTKENQGVTNPPLDKVNAYTMVRERVKNDILLLDPKIVSEKNIEDTDVTALDSAVARVMASQMVTLNNGKTISIFSPRYAPYNKGPNNQKDLKIDASDMDFYEERSEAMMSDPKVVNLILHTNYSGRFDDLDRAGFFITNVAETAKELDDAAVKSPSQKKEMEEAAALFRANMGGKIQNWLEGEMRTASKATVATERTKEGKYALLELFNAGILKVEFLAEKGGKLAEDLLIQCREEGNPAVKAKAKVAIERLLEAKNGASRKKNRRGGGTVPPIVTP